ncbi:MAG: gamma-glutamyl-gamma-aminobutyrate hydrolase family protein [Dehalococcoidia bacterium]|nr:gamma-glutamyl-gamma-aminobutyrate hydrolase family protein [Dehalococcoidia bacterium]
MVPLVGLTTSLAMRAPVRAQLNVAYIQAVERAGGLPVLLPPSLGPRALSGLLGRLQAVVLTGGGDVDPARYGEERHPTVEGDLPERDALEEEVVRDAIARNLPILAVCRGQQMLNVARGGSLCQDIPSALPHAVAHAGRDEGDNHLHEVRVEPESRLAAVLGGDRFRVNSRHHQAVARLGDGLVPVAWSPDGVVEGLELPGRRFALAVQWHPEDMAVAGDAAAMRLFQALVAAAGEG